VQSHKAYTKQYTIFILNAAWANVKKFVDFFLSLPAGPAVPEKASGGVGTF